MKKKELTGYASIDNPQSKNSSFFEKNPIIPNISVYTLFTLLSSSYSNKPAIDCINLKADYAQLKKDAITISCALKELGVRKGDIVSVSMPNLYQAMAAFFACNRIGATITFLSYGASAEEICSYLNLFESPIFINYDKDEEYNQIIKGKSSVKHIITLNKTNLNSLALHSDYRVTSNDKLIDFNSLGSIAQYQKSIEIPHSYKENALILFTSGSTGEPKPVVLTNENVIAAEIYAKNTSHTENITGPSTLVCVPFSYPYGLVTSALTTLLWGKEAILAPNIGKNTIGYYYSKKPSIVFGSPALLDLTINNIPNDQDLSFVTHFISGGDFLTVHHAKRGTDFFEKHGAKVEVGNGFGNAETVSIGSTPVGVPLRQETAGKILVGSKVMIVDPETLQEKRYGEEGLLCVAGRHVFKEYFGKPKLTSEVKFVHNGIEYYNTGTLGMIDENGYFIITGRQSRFYINSSLNKVYCDYVQNVISNFEFVKDCAVVKVPDDEQLYVNTVFVVLENNIEQSEKVKTLINDLCDLPVSTPDGRIVQLKTFEKPTYIEFINELPRKLESEKIDYTKLEQLALERLPKAKVIKLENVQNINNKI